MEHCCRRHNRNHRMALVAVRIPLYLRADQFPDDWSDDAGAVNTVEPVERPPISGVVPRARRVARLVVVSLFWRLALEQEPMLDFDVRAIHLLGRQSFTVQYPLTLRLYLVDDWMACRRLVSHEHRWNLVHQLTPAPCGSTIRLEGLICAASTVNSSACSTRATCSPTTLAIALGVRAPLRLRLTAECPNMTWTCHKPSWMSAARTRAAATSRRWKRTTLALMDLPNGLAMSLTPLATTPRAKRQPPPAHHFLPVRWLRSNCAPASSWGAAAVTVIVCPVWPAPPATGEPAGTPTGAAVGR